MTTDTSRKRHTRRRLTDDEKKLWKTVARSIAPLEPGKLASIPDMPDLSATVEAPAVSEDAAQAIESSIRPVKKMPALAPLGQRLRRRLARGGETIDRRIDLHGLTQAQAHRALERFLRASQSDHVKTVLVVTGKGTRIADPDPFAQRGVLRRLVPQWLSQPEFRDLVVGFEPAHATHGGAGALYVRLRKPR